MAGKTTMMAAAAAANKEKDNKKRPISRSSRAGLQIGRVFGPEFMLTLYLSGAVAGSVFYLVYHAFMSSSSKSKQMWINDPANIPRLVSWHSYLSTSPLFLPLISSHMVSMLVCTGLNSSFPS